MIYVIYDKILIPNTNIHKICLYTKLSLFMYIFLKNYKN